MTREVLDELVEEEKDRVVDPSQLQAPFEGLLIEQLFEQIPPGTSCLSFYGFKLWWALLYTLSKRDKLKGLVLVPPKPENFERRGTSNTALGRFITTEAITSYRSSPMSSSFLPETPLLLISASRPRINTTEQSVPFFYLLESTFHLATSRTFRTSWKQRKYK